MPAAYIRSSTSTVSGKKSSWSLGFLEAVVADSTIVSPMLTTRGAGGLPGQAPGLEADGAGAEAAVVDDGLGCVDLLLTLHGSSSSY